MSRQSNTGILDTNHMPSATLNVREAPCGTDVEQATVITSLPAETLSQILSYVLICEDQPVSLCSTEQVRWTKEFDETRARSLVTKNKHAQGRKLSLLEVLLTCKSFYFAGIEAFYGGNELAFSSTFALRGFLEVVRTDRARCITKVVVCANCNVWLNYHESLMHTWKSPKGPGALAKIFKRLKRELPKLETVQVNLNVARAVCVGMWIGRTRDSGERQERQRQFDNKKAELTTLIGTSAEAKSVRAQVQIIDSYMSGP